MAEHPGTKAAGRLRRILCPDGFEREARRHLPMVISGSSLIRIEDTRKACALGVDGVVVSNHGGRQLDGAIAPLRAVCEGSAARSGLHHHDDCK